MVSAKRWENIRSRGFGCGVQNNPINEQQREQRVNPLDKSAFGHNADAGILAK